MIAGMMKQRIDKYKEIVETLLAKGELSPKQISFLTKEKVLK